MCVGEEMLDGLLHACGSRVGVFPLLGPFVAFWAPVARARRRRVRLIGLLGLGEGALDIRQLLALLHPGEHVEVLEILVGAAVLAIHGEHPDHLCRGTSVGDAHGEK